jgi:hypothetical protein
MSGAVHTPGPWVAGPAASIRGADGRSICRMTVRFDETEIADWHLVIAAPELLEQIELMVAVSRSTSGFSPMIRKQAEAVIAKARGNV